MDLTVEQASGLLLGGSAIAAYAATRAALDALVPAHKPATTQRVIVHGGMVAIVSLVALFHRSAMVDIAVGTPFAAAVAAATLVLGVIVMVNTQREGDAVPRRETAAAAAQRGPLAFLLPVALLLLLIGFTGKISGQDGLVLMVEGFAIFLVSRRPALRARRSTMEAGKARDEAAQPRRHPVLVILELLLAIALAVLAAWALVQAAGELALHNPAFRPGVAAAVVMGPIIVLPMITPLATLAESGRGDEAINAAIGFVLVSLCVVLPVVAWAYSWVPGDAAATQPASQPAEAAVLPFSMILWRLDTVLLGAVGLLLLPIATGRWKLSRTEGLGLITMYVMFLFLSLVLSR
jgi:Ca2+/Na+ antiporter